MRHACLVFSLLTSACATVGPRASTCAVRSVSHERSAPVLVAEAEPRSACDGMRIALLVQDDASRWESAAHRIELRCHAHGATLTVRTTAPEQEDTEETIELTTDEAAALWTELRGVSLSALACGHAPGTRSHRVEISGAHGDRVVECDAAQTPASWAALETMLTSVHGPREDLVWPFEAEQWRDEIGYARAMPRPES